MTLLARRLEWQRRARPERADLRIALLSSFTVDPLVPYLGMGLADDGIEAEIVVGPYGQIMQQCLDPQSETSRARPDIVVVWPRLEDLWAARPLPLDEDADAYADDLLAMVDAAGHVAASGSTVVFILPAVPEMRPLGVGDANNVRGVFAVSTAAREAARARLAELVRRRHRRRGGGRPRAREHRCGRLASPGAVARIPYQEAAFDAMGRRAGPPDPPREARGRQGRRGRRRSDPVGRDRRRSGRGPDRPVRQRPGRGAPRVPALPGRVAACGAPPHGREQERSRRRLGGLRATRRWSSGILSLATARVSWDEKADSITAIADELNLGTASFVLIDDSPIECEKVTFQLPEVRALQMPEDAVGWFDAIGRSGALDRLPPNETDRLRAASVPTGSRSGACCGAATSMEDFLASLELRVDIRPLAAADVPRVAQLIAKTNQFTLAGRRRSEAEVSAMVGDSRLAGYAVSAPTGSATTAPSARWSSIGRPTATDVPAGAAVLDTFVLSCRAMGRGVETAMLAGAFDGAPARLDERREAPRNQPARDFFAGHGCAEVASEVRAAPAGVAGTRQRRFSRQRPDRLPPEARSGEQVEGDPSGLVEAEPLLGDAPALASHRRSTVGIGQQRLERRRQIAAVARLRDEAVDAVIDDVRGAAGVGDDDRQRAAHRFDGGDAERLGEARQDEDVGLLVQLEQLGAVRPDVVVDDDAGRRLDRLPGHEVELDAVRGPVPEPVEQQLATLPAEVAAHEQHLPRGRLADRRVVGWRPERHVGAEGDHDDLVLGHSVVPRPCLPWPSDEVATTRTDRLAQPGR